ncbi:hypothetical protein J6590_048498 [Homalodisca vitripennis]|nr:hypothetical protein J6590_048498 [Homalodisca vitripennis]
MDDVRNYPHNTLRAGITDRDVLNRLLNERLQEESTCCRCRIVLIIPSDSRESRSTSTVLCNPRGISRSPAWCKGRSSKVY